MVCVWLFVGSGHLVFAGLSKAAAALVDIRGIAGSHLLAGVCCCPIESDYLDWFSYSNHRFSLNNFVDAAAEIVVEMQQGVEERVRMHVLNGVNGVSEEEE